MKTCSYCVSASAVYLCGDCKKEVYCSDICQLKSWMSSHSITCYYQKIGACPVENDYEKLVVKFMSPNCPDTFALTPEKIAMLQSTTEKSKVFSESFKKTVYERINNFLKNLPVSSYVEKEPSSATSGKTILVSLESASLTDSTADKRIKVKGGCKKLGFIKSTEVCRNDVDIRLRVIDLNNLQKYTDKYVAKLRATCKYDPGKNKPTTTEDPGTGCNKSYMFNIPSRYVVIIHHHFFDKLGNDRFSGSNVTDPAFFVPYAISPELSTTKGLTAKVEFYSKKDVKTDPQNESHYKLTLYYKDGPAISKEEIVPFEYNVTKGEMKLLKK